jgi:hypothetical protein
MLSALKENKFVQICSNILLEETIFVEEIMVCDAEPFKTGAMLRYFLFFESSRPLVLLLRRLLEQDEYGASVEWN